MTDRILPSLTELTLGDLSSLLVRTGGMALPQGPEEEARYIGLSIAYKYVVGCFFNG